MKTKKVKKTLKRILKYSFAAIAVYCGIWSLFVLSTNAFGNTGNICTLPANKTIIFLDGEEGFNYIRKSGYIEKLSKLDIELRMQKEMANIDLEDSRMDYEAFLKNQVLNWNQIDKRYMIRRMKNAYSMIQYTTPNVLQDTVFMILTSGKQEFSSFYTLDNAIVCPRGKIRMSSVYLPFLKYLKNYFNKVMIHELFHIYSTNNPEKRDELYKIVGFEKILDLELAPNVKSKLIMNPDDKLGFYKITLTEKKSKIPKEYCLLILSKYPKWEGVKEFKGRISVLLVYVDAFLHQIEIDGSGWVSSLDENQEPIIQSKSDFIDFYSKTGYDTYSPEEIAAHLFIDLTLSKYDDDVLRRKSECYKELLKKLELQFNLP